MYAIERNAVEGPCPGEAGQLGDFLDAAKAFMNLELQTRAEGETLDNLINFACIDLWQVLRSD